MDQGGVEVRDLSYDYYGQRVATCSSDQMIRVYNTKGALTASWKAHLGSIWRILWAHPEFGQVLITCSFDRKVCIWEEHADAEDLTQQSGHGPGGWRLQAELLDARDSVQHISLAPKHLGLRLASCGPDRVVRVHEAADVVDLSKWGLLSEFEPDAPEPASATSATSAKAHGGSGGSETTRGGALNAKRGSPNCVAWSPSVLEAPMLAVGMTDGAIYIWACNEDGGWARAHVVEPIHRGCINDMNYAPDVGRSYGLLATASDDKSVRLWKLRRKVPRETGAGAPARGGTAVAVREALEASVLQELAHDSIVWRCVWCAAGSMIACSVDEGAVHIYKQDEQGVWKSSQVKRGD